GDRALPADPAQAGTDGGGAVQRAEHGVPLHRTRPCGQAALAGRGVGHEAVLLRGRDRRGHGGGTAVRWQRLHGRVPGRTAGPSRQVAHDLRGQQRGPGDAHRQGAAPHRWVRRSAPSTFGPMNTRSDIAENARGLVNDAGGFPAQEQQPPGLTSDMTPVPDHGEDSYRGSGRLDGLKTLITGGDSGIGSATAIAFAREGADGAIAYLPGEQSYAEETASWIAKAGRRAALLPADLRVEDECRSVVRDAARQLGGLDVLVNNAGFQHARGAGLETLDTENLDRVMKTNLYATFWTSQEALNHLGPGSSIINTTSIQAYEPAPPLLDYASTK